MSIQSFHLFLIVMAVIAVVVFVSLYFVDAGYGKFYNPKWGPAVNNKLGWVLMESPVFIAMLLLWLFSDRRGDLAAGSIISHLQTITLPIGSPTRVSSPVSWCSSSACISTSRVTTSSVISVRRATPSIICPKVACSAM